MSRGCMYMVGAEMPMGMNGMNGIPGHGYYYCDVRLLFCWWIAKSTHGAETCSPWLGGNVESS